MAENEKAELEGQEEESVEDVRREGLSFALITEQLSHILKKDSSLTNAWHRWATINNKILEGQLD